MKTHPATYFALLARVAKWLRHRFSKTEFIGSNPILFLRLVSNIEFLVEVVKNTAPASGQMRKAREKRISLCCLLFYGGVAESADAADFGRRIKNL